MKKNSSKKNSPYLLNDPHTRIQIIYHIFQLWTEFDARSAFKYNTMALDKLWV